MSAGKILNTIAPPWMAQGSFRHLVHSQRRMLRWVVKSRGSDTWLKASAVYPACGVYA